jgi:hypothetical protein
LLFGVATILAALPPIPSIGFEPGLTWLLIFRFLAGVGHEAALRVITGLISGMAAEEIRRHYDLTAVEYDTTRRRIRRTLLRHGLAWSWP